MRAGAAWGPGDEGRKDPERAGALPGGVGTLRGEGSSDARDPSSGPSRGSPVPSGQSSNVAPKARPPRRPQLCLFARSSRRTAALAFRFLRLAIRLPASGFLHMPFPVSATSFYSFRLADSHSFFGSRHQRHFLCEALLSRSPSRSPPLKRSYRFLCLSFMSLGGGSHLLLDLYLCGSLVTSVTMSSMEAGRCVLVTDVFPSTAPSRRKLPVNVR